MYVKLSSRDLKLPSRDSNLSPPPSAPPTPQTPIHAQVRLFWSLTLINHIPTINQNNKFIITTSV